MPPPPPASYDDNRKTVLVEVQQLIVAVASLRTEVTRHLSEQDDKLSKLARDIDKTHEILTGGLKPEDGVLMRLREVTNWMKSSRNTQKWITRTAIASILAGVGLSSAALIFTWLHLPH